jgi:FkbM family methyltransferase
VKHFDFGLDVWADMAELFRGKPPGVLFDVGANCGQTALQMATIFAAARVLAFEPNPDVFPALQRKIAHLPQVSAFQMALGERQTRIALNICGSALNTSVLQYAREDGKDRVVRQEESIC